MAGLAAPQIDKIPTVELHRHFEAGMTPEVIATLAQRNGIEKFLTREGEVVDGVDPQDPDSIRAYVDSVVNGFSESDGIVNFLNAYRMLSSVFGSEDDLEYAAYEQMKGEHEAGSIHAELRASPMSLSGPVGAPIKNVIAAMQAGINRAYDDFGVSGTFISCFSREKGLITPEDADYNPKNYDPLKDQARHVVDAVLELYDPDNPVGIDIAGIENAQYPPKRFLDVLSPARDAGVPLTVHAGEQGEYPQYEGAPPSFVEDAILQLGARRIGHGTSMSIDPILMTLAKERGIGVETCPVSNDLMRFTPLRHSPLRQFLERGIKATICTDDPLFFGVSSVMDMLKQCGARLYLRPEDMAQIAKNGVATAFVGDARRVELKAKLTEKLTLLGMY
ncbi:MAG: hypothetical protein O3B47_00045 [bacterium]|nr:hypothetical protein [bacterium]